MARQFDVIVLGDLNMELVCKLDAVTFAEISRDTLLYRPIDFYIGGTAANFATAALQHFRDVHLIGKVGADPPGALIIQHLKQAGVKIHCTEDTESQTGTAVHIRDANPDYACGVRLLVVQMPSANHRLTPVDVEQCADILSACDLFVLDGYCLLKEPRRTASLRAMELAHEADVLVVFDIVPHTAYQLYSLDTLKSVLTYANVVIAEVKTIRHFLSLDVPDGILGVELARDTLDSLRVEFPDKIFFLRFGIGNCDESLLCVPGEVAQHNFTGYRQTVDLRGFGDVLAARELKALLERIKLC